MAWRRVPILVGLFLLAGRCDSPSRPSAPPEGWVALLPSDTSTHGIFIQDLIPRASDILVGGVLSGPQGVRAWIRKLTWSGEWLSMDTLPQGIDLTRIVPLGGNRYALTSFFNEGFPCFAPVVDAEGRWVDTVLVVDPQAYTCTILDVLQTSDGWMATGFSGDLFDTTQLFVAHVARNRQFWFVRKVHGSNTFNVGGLLLLTPRGYGVVGVTGDHPGGQSFLWLLEISPQGSVLRDTLLAKNEVASLVRRESAVMGVALSPHPSLFAWDFQTFSLVWDRPLPSETWIALMDADETSPLGTLVWMDDSSALWTARVDVRTGQMQGNRKLYDRAGWLMQLREDSRGLLLNMLFLDSVDVYTGVVFVPHGGVPPDLPDSILPLNRPAVPFPQHVQPWVFRGGTVP